VEGIMKSLWSYFVAGIFMTAFLFTVLKSSNASEKDPRVKSIDDPSMSALKTPVPESAEMEDALVQRKQELEGKEKLLKEIEKRLAVQEERVKGRIEELQQLQQKQSEFKTAEVKQRESVTATLVKTYETMSPKKASGVISVMEDRLAVELLMAMKPKRVAAILDVMEPNRAMTLSTKIAERRPAGSAVVERQPSANQ
jgi:flagellar motility protein MotE (MotC chaperone)